MINTSLFIRRVSSIFFFAGILLLISATPLKDGLSEDVLKYTNQFRKSKGLPALTMRSDLNEIARKHSEDMASGRCSFGHAGFNQRIVKAQKLIKPFGGMAENVAYGANNAQEAFSIWKNSTGHRKNMLGNYKYIGIGTARNRRGVIFYTQVFVR